MAHRRSRGIALPLLDHGTRSGWWVVTLRPLFTPVKTRYPLYRRPGVPQGRSGQVQKISPPLGFDPWTVQPVASHYTEWATRPTAYNNAGIEKVNWCTKQMCCDLSGLLVCNIALRGLNLKFNYVISGITRDLQSLTASNKGDSESDVQDQTPYTDQLCYPAQTYVIGSPR